MKIIYTHVVLVFAMVAVLACNASERTGSEVVPSHDIWDRLLKKHVDEKGWVDYKGFISDKVLLEEYLKLLSDHAPDKAKWTREEQLAYWINAYNAFTIKLIVDNYPVKSIKDLKPTLNIPGIHTVWHRQFFKIGGIECSLDEIEHDILRKQFDEPRIHFAINCASYSCPPLRNEAYKASLIDEQLQAQAEWFINDGKRNLIAENQIRISSIFSWFRGDFTKRGDLIDYLNQYSKVVISQDANINYLEYDWRLNEQH
ncbi:DUF547 domain-containing protein [Fulvivirga sediminis]|uniref:DUF547 domain-containing protein n=1 Tax=Fulvivirga sediminis TaxID=2803949 RepID=A0A937JXH3_9BACT|nr:DUF547 domain-containing protein [Fulvivirga sediminis]MBL3655478.1 DUF547 domain-containing protein [Fulvivirga sediminis]